MRRAPWTQPQEKDASHREAQRQGRACRLLIRTRHGTAAGHPASTKNTTGNRQKHGLPRKPWWRQHEDVFNIKELKIGWQTRTGTYVTGRCRLWRRDPPRMKSTRNATEVHDDFKNHFNLCKRYDCLNKNTVQRRVCNKWPQAGWGTGSGHRACTALRTACHGLKVCDRP